MKIKLTIDAMPILAERGGISNYVIPLIEHFLRISEPYFDTTLHFRTGSPDRRRQFRSLPNCHSSRLNNSQYWKTNLPDRILKLLWKMNNLPFGTIALPQTDIYLATTEMMPRYNGIKKIAIVYDLIPAIISQFFKETRSHYLNRITSSLKNCDAIIAISKATANDIATLCGIEKSKITVIYPGISLPTQLNTSEESELKFPEVNRPFVLYVGALSPNKNVEAVIQCFAHFIKATNYDWQLVLVGKNFMHESYFQEIAKQEGVIERVVFTGWVSEEIKHFLFRKAKILLQFSWYEGFGLPVIEAMSCALPTIASNRGSIPEVISNMEQLIDPSKPIEAAEKLSQFALDSDLQLRWKIHAIQRAKEFNWEKSAEILLMRLRELHTKTC